MQRMIIITIIVAVLTVGALSGPTNIDPSYEFSWGENIGWLNWEKANGGIDGVHVRSTFLGGFIWAENVGWINVGNGSPANGTSYANVDGTEFGVNIDPTTGDLFGLAWGENVGWVNFDTRDALGSHDQQARFDYGTGEAYWSGRFRGYAWGENVGWVNLDHATHYVAVIPIYCQDPFADVDDDTDVDQEDFGGYQVCFSGSGNLAPLGCECFDRPEPGFPQGDNDVDSYDRQAFEDCASGPAVPADQSCDD